MVHNSKGLLWFLQENTAGDTVVSARIYIHIPAHVISLTLT